VRSSLNSGRLSPAYNRHRWTAWPLGRFGLKHHCVWRRLVRCGHATDGQWRSACHLKHFGSADYSISSGKLQRTGPVEGDECQRATYGQHHGGCRRTAACDLAFRKPGQLFLHRRREPYFTNGQHCECGRRLAFVVCCLQRPMAHRVSGQRSRLRSDHARA